MIIQNKVGQLEDNINATLNDHCHRETKVLLLVDYEIKTLQNVKNYESKLLLQTQAIVS